MEENKVKNLEGEVWLPVVGYEGIYECSNLGRIKSVRSRKEHLMKQRHDRDGYLMLGLFKDGQQKFFQAHRIIGMAFLPNPSGLPEINHKNEIKDDNRVDNIEWCSRKYNANYGTAKIRSGKASRKPVQCIETGKIYDYSGSAVKDLDKKINQASIGRACLGKQKTAGGYHWRYV